MLTNLHKVLLSGSNISLNMRESIALLFSKSPVKLYKIFGLFCKNVLWWPFIVCTNLHKLVTTVAHKEAHRVSA